MDLEWLLRGGRRAGKPRHKRAVSMHEVSVSIASPEFDTLKNSRNRRRREANRFFADIIGPKAEQDLFPDMTSGSIGNCPIQNEP